MQTAHYVRLYNDVNGESHFEDLEVELNPTDFAPPAAPLNIAHFLPTAQSIFVGASVNWGGDAPHPTPRRQIFCFMAGECEVTASDGSKRRFSKGHILMLEDTWGQGHSTRILGEEELLIFGVSLEDT